MKEKWKTNKHSEQKIKEITENPSLLHFNIPRWYCLSLLATALGANNFFQSHFVQLRPNVLCADLPQLSPDPYTLTPGPPAFLSSCFSPTTSCLCCLFSYFSISSLKISAHIPKPVTVKRIHNNMACFSAAPLVTREKRTVKAAAAEAFALPRLPVSMSSLLRVLFHSAAPHHHFVLPGHLTPCVCIPIY